MKRILITCATLGTLALATPALAEDGAELFNKTCSTCHGKDGKGETLIGKKLQIKNLSVTTFNDADIEKQILEGKKGDDGKDRMPPFKAALTPEQIKAIIGYVRATIIVKS
ncbi:MAG: cytochrome c [Deltaproteobacteria bacterium]|nr:cytochrome c [Deltaproteobacteria bacterium]